MVVTDNTKPVDSVLTGTLAESGPLFSQHWYRISHLRPRLVDGVQIRHQRVRDQDWVVLTRNGHSKRVRLNAAAYAVVGRCDGSASLDQLFSALLTIDPDGVPTQAECITFAAKLIADGYLQCVDWPDLDAALDEQRKDQRRQTRLRLNPLAPRLNLGNPNQLLSRLDPLGLFIFSRYGLAAWLCLLAWGVFTLASQWSMLRAFGQEWLASPSAWLVSLLCYPVIKLIHEACHGLAVRRWGGDVNEAGIGLLMFFPAPYVDASAAAQFARASQRAWVSVAGIAAELFIAAGALLLWQALEPGLLKNLLFSTALIAGISTVAFNANPLVRLDGYYVLSDLAQLPNLAQRSQQYWQAQVAVYLLGIDQPTQQVTRAEQRWLLGYAPLSWCYRASIMIWAIWFLGNYSRLLALIITVAAAMLLLVLPLKRLLALPALNNVDLPKRARAYVRFGLATLALMLIVLVPIPDRDVVQGVVWTPEDATIRAANSGFVTNLLIREQQTVARDDAVLVLSDPSLAAQIEVLQERLTGLRAKWLSKLRDDAAQARHAQESMRQTEAELTHLRTSQQRLLVTSKSQGKLLLTRRWSDMVGRYVREGEVLGYTRTPTPPRVRVALTQFQASRLRDAHVGGNQGENIQGVATVPMISTVQASLRLAQSPENTMAARIEHFVPAAIEALPSAALAQRNGGAIVLDALLADKLKPAAPTYLIDVVANQTADAELGSRAWVRIDFGYASALLQSIRWLRQMINTRMAIRWD